MMLGLFENPYPDKDRIALIGTPENQEANLQAAVESIVLVQNNKNILPLKPGTNLLLTGPTANLLSVMNGGWTITWQGNEESLYPKNANTVLKAFQNKYGLDKVTYSEGTSFDKDINTTKTIEQAKKADAIVVCLGEPTYCESPGNINDLELEAAQIKLVDELSKLNKPIVVLMIEGRPRIIRKIADKVDAILIAMLPGMRGGDAIAKIVSGESVPSGKLPFTYPKYPATLFHYDIKPIEQTNDLKYDPQWKFGYGLSYTSFEYSNLKVDKKIISKKENINVTVDVKNIGKVTALESVQLFLCDLYGSVSRPVKQLRGFEKISLQPGETKSVSFTLHPDALSFIGRENTRIIEAGDFVIYVSNLEQKFTLK